MVIISEKKTLSEIIITHPETIALINRFGITLGTGDKTIETICNEKNLDIDFFIVILNTYLNEEFFPEKILKSFNAHTIINYISQTYSYYTHYMLPNIERHFNLLISHSGNNNNLELMHRFFIELKEDILRIIEHDSSLWFPAIESINTNNVHSDLITQPLDSTIIEDKINDLKNMFVIHLTGQYEVNLCHAVILSIIALEKDIKQNNRIRNRILYLICNNIAKLK